MPKNNIRKEKQSFLSPLDAVNTVLNCHSMEQNNEKKKKMEGTDRTTDFLSLCQIIDRKRAAKKKENTNKQFLDKIILKKTEIFEIEKRRKKEIS